MTPESIHVAELPPTPQPANISDAGSGDGSTRALKRRRAQLLDRHWTMLIVSVAVVVIAFTLQINPIGRVRASWLPFESLPPMCGSRVWFGINCPGCGLTRSFVALASGNFAESFHYHRVGWLIALAVVLQIPYRTWRLWELRRGIYAEQNWPAWFGWVLITALVLNWLASFVF